MPYLAVLDRQDALQIVGTGCREALRVAADTAPRCRTTASRRSELKAARSPIQVACVSPGFVDTPLLDNYFRGREETLSKTRAGMKMLQPEDVAHCIMTILTAPPHVEVSDILLRSSDQIA
jgi:NADP-dependent 3-hydroxy acid dehydrogenase YdfG